MPWQRDYDRDIALPLKSFLARENDACLRWLLVWITPGLFLRMWFTKLIWEEKIRDRNKFVTVCAQFRALDFYTSSHKYIHCADTTTLRKEAVVWILFLKMDDEKAEITLSTFSWHFFFWQSTRKNTRSSFMKRHLIFGSRYRAWNHFPCYAL